MKHEQYISDKEKLAKITAIAGLGAVALTGCVGVGIYETDNETPDLATITEQTAVDLVNEYNTHPENFDESATDIVKIPKNGNIYSTVTEYVERYGEEHDWSTDQQNLHAGIINESSAEIYSTINGVAQPGTEIVMYQTDLNDDGITDVTPVGIKR